MDEVRGDFFDIKVRSFGSNENIQREIVVSIDNHIGLNPCLGDKAYRLLGSQIHP